LGVIILGTLPLILKLLVRVVDPVTLSSVRFLGAGLLLGLFGRSEVVEDLRVTISKGRLPYMILTASGLTCNYVFFVWGLKFLSPSSVHIVLQVAPFLVLAGGVFFFREPYTIRLAFGALLLAVGSGLFFNQRTGELMLGSSLTIGIGIALVSACGWAVFFLTQKTLHGVMRSRSILFYTCLTGGTALLPFASPSQLLELDTRLLIFLILSTFGTAIAYTSISSATRQVTATTMGFALALIPLVTVVDMALLSDRIDGLEPENLNSLAIFGATLVVTGLIIGTRNGRNVTEREST
jgi:drug/metabolite transporter (DMT)-like permease